MHFLRFGLALLLVAFSICSVIAAPTPQNLYYNPKNKQKPEAIIFYNSANPCYHCSKAIEMIISVLKQNYPNRLRTYLINIQNHPEFISAFDLSGPLTLVLVRISDGAQFGHTKLTGLQSETDSLTNFSQIITEKINNFLNLPPKN